MKYPIVIHKDNDTDFGVTVPDVPGCFSAGTTLEETIEMAHEAIECHLEGMLMDGEAIPLPSAIETHHQNQDYAGGIWALVDIDLSKLSVKSRRVNITIPERLLNAVDHYAKKHGESRSGLLAQAVTEYMATHR
ncbi:type II toxin-antitoxin system HicB family antitoxin [Marinospirillum alkaliphilum]|uniref:Predicted nuclease of the RNAse H fold, HicB family n=1 Tax=Marinospirillum alkaliphilum DSM 21637 TaxID=1122209 RepID=A0A1K1XYM9_9GAMM|nr:type II toxin-antitoxin system HicB family antitoxin [Marinospirillum alkaliphilum]SFX54842.1 Predicted nuclease of the RNAse H fold, HicB family [Marinospirillum alkaliphilum DSM 21637]